MVGRKDKMKIRISDLESIINDVINESHILNEYINNDMISLRDYLSMSIESKMAYLPYEYSYLFNDFLIEMDYDYVRPKEMVKSDYEDEPEQEVDMFEYDEELITHLDHHDKKTFNDFAKYLYDKIENFTLPIDPAEYPAWTYFDKPVLVKNQWLIHFTTDSNAIAMEGFKYGVDDMTKLGLTTSLSDFNKKYGGYNFAYLINDFYRYGRSSYGNWNRSGYKYGNEAVIFNASGIKVWHQGDEEPQVIFYGNTARNIIPIKYDVDTRMFQIYNKRNEKLLYENEKLTVVVDWLINNFNQYRKSFV